MADYTKDNFADDLFPSLAEQSDTTPSYTQDNFADDLFPAPDVTPTPQAITEYVPSDEAVKTLQKTLRESSTAEQKAEAHAAFRDGFMEPAKDTAKPKPVEPNSYWDDLSSALTSGYRDMRAGVASTGVMAGIDSPENAADTMLEAFKNRPTAPEYVQSYIDKIMAEGMDVSKAEGVVDTSLQFMDLMASTFIESVKNPKATGYTIAQSLSNSIPALALGGAGFLTPVPGGFAVGTGLGTFAVEAGAHFNGLLQEKLAEQGKNPSDVTREDILALLESKDFTDYAEEQAAKAGLAVSVVEALMAATGLKIIKNGVDKAADKGVKQTFGSQVSRDAASFGLEVSGEGFGEAAKQVVTDGEMNYGDIALETITGLGQSVGTVAIEQVGTSLLNQIPTRKAKDELDNVFGEGVDDIPADPLGAMLDEANAPQAEAPAPKAPEPMDAAIAEAMRIAEQYPELQDAAAAIRANGELTDAGVALQLARQALDTPFAQRTEGQQAMVQYARGYDAKVDKESATTTDEIAQALAGTQPAAAPVDPLAPPADPVAENPAVKKAVLDNLDPALLTAQDKEFLNNYEVQQDGKATDGLAGALDTPVLNEVSTGAVGTTTSQTGISTPADSLTQVAGAVPVQQDNKGTTPTTSEEITDGNNTRRADTNKIVGEGAAESNAAATDGVNTSNATNDEGSQKRAQVDRLELENELSNLREAKPQGIKAKRETKARIAELEALIQQDNKGTTPEVKADEPTQPRNIPIETSKGTTDPKGAYDIQDTISESRTKPRTDTGATSSKGAVKDGEGPTISTSAELETLRASQPKGIKAQRETKARIAELEKAVKTEIDTAAQDTATSPTTDIAEPTQAQIDAGNYKKAHIKVAGLDVAIENPKGSTRKGVDQKGKEWSSEMKDHYGYIKRTKGADGDQVDVFIGDNPTSDKIFVVDQVDPTTGNFDEHKVVVGAKSPAQAKMFYNRNYDKGWKGAAAVTEFTPDGFKTWLKESDTTKPASSEVKANEKATAGSDSAQGSTKTQTAPVSEVGVEDVAGTTVGADGTKTQALTPTVEDVTNVDRSLVGGRMKGNLAARQASDIAASIAKSMYGGKSYAEARADAVKNDSFGGSVFDDALAQVIGKKKSYVAPKAPVDKKAEARKKQQQVNDTDSLVVAIAKKGGLDKAHWLSQGVDPASTKRGGSGVKAPFGKPVFRAEGGMTADDVAELARELGYGNDIDANKAVEMVIDELNGNASFTPAGAVENYALENEIDGTVDMTPTEAPKTEPAKVDSPAAFSLTGSNRASDANPNQTDMLTPKPKPMSEPTFEDDDDSGDMFGPAPTEDTKSAKRETPTAMSEGGPTESLKDVVPQPITLYDMLKKNSPADVLRYIKAHTESPSLAAVIDRMIDFVPNNLKIKVISDGDTAPGSLQNARGIFVLSADGTNTIYLKDETFVSNGMNDETVVHEMLHAITVSLLEAGQLPANKDTELGRAVKDIAKLRNEVVREINRRIKSGELKQTDNLLNAALKDIGEFISWGLTNAEFQQILKTVHVNYETVWSKFVTAVAKMFGISQNDRTALEALMSSTEVLLAADSAPSVAWLLDKQRQSSSFKHAIIDVDNMDKIQQLELSISTDEVLRDERLDIAAGRRVKQAEAEITQLQEEIQERRSQDPHFVKGTDNIDAQGERLLAPAKEYMTLSERMHKTLEDKLAFWKDIPYIFGRMTSSAYFIENAERKVFGKTQSAELSATASIHQAANSKVAASMVVHETGVQLVNGSIVPVEGTLGLRQVLEEVSKHGTRYLRRFEQYLLLNRSKVLMEQGRENFVTQEEIDNMDAWLSRNPNTKALFEKQAKEFAKWNKNVLQVAIDSGWINAQDAYGGYKFVTDDGTEILGPNNTFFETEEDALAAGQSADLKGTTEATEGWYDEMYVPFYRVAEDTGVKAPKRGGKKPGDLGKATQKLKGGVGAIPILDNIMRNAEFLIDGSMKTIAMQRVKKLFENTMFEEISVGDVGNLELAPMVDPAKIKAEYADMKAQAEIDGLPMPELSDKDTKRWAALRKFARPTDKNAVAIFENGRATYYKVLDQKLLTAVKSIGAYQAANWIKIVGMPTRILQQAITIMPAFLVRSFVRELQNTFIINSKGSLNPLTTIGKAVKNLTKIASGKDPWMQEMMAGGYVNYNTYFQATPDNLRRELEKVGVKKSTFNTVLQSPWTGLKSMGRLYHQIAVATEHAARKTVYNDAIKAGATPQEAKYQALDMMNFGRRSDFAAMEVLLATVPFLNPRIQGMDRLYRGVKEDPKTFLLKGALMAGAATALAVFNWEENGDEMEKLKDEDKALNFHLFLDMGGTEKVHWRIPKGFEVGQITGTLPEFAIENLKSKTPEPVSKAINRFLTLTFGVQYPQFLAPMLDVGVNKDPFRQRPIISYGQQFLLPPAQFDTYTSKLIIDMAHAAPDDAPDWMRSPKKLEYLIKGYTGSLGAMVLEGVDDIYRATGNAPDAPTKKMSEMYILRDYIQTGAVKTSKQNDLFYDMVSEVGKLSSTLMAAKDYDMSEYRTMKAENRDKLSARKALNKYSKRMSDISKEIKDVFESDLSPDMKALKKDRLIEKKNKLAQEAVDKYWYIFE
jgi:hypothetical protein